MISIKGNLIRKYLMSLRVTYQVHNKIFFTKKEIVVLMRKKAKKVMNQYYEIQMKNYLNLINSTNSNNLNKENGANCSTLMGK